MKEANIVINGQQLSEQESMTLRVAIGCFIISMAEPEPLGSDEHGETMTVSYRKHLDTINIKLLSN